jgi:hypothetical protein
MPSVAQRRLAWPVLLALAWPWLAALGAAVHVTVHHGHSHEPSRILASLQHGHEHAAGTPDHGHVGLLSAKSLAKAAPAAWACALPPALGADLSVHHRWVAPQAHPPPWSARLSPGDLLRI